MQSFRNISHQQLGASSNLRLLSSTCQQTRCSTFQPSRVTPSTSLLQFSSRLTTPVSSRTSPLQRCRTSSFLHDNSISSSSRQPQKTTRESYLSRRRRQRNAGSKISTLALDHNPIPLEAALENVEDRNSSRSESRQEQKEQKDSSNDSSTRTMSPRSRRLLLLAGLLLFPVVGRDLIEAVIPGLLGVLIFVGGNVKAALKWVKSLSRSGGSQPEKDR